jgi:hypothetical protein
MRQHEEIAIILVELFREHEAFTKMAWHTDAANTLLKIGDFIYANRVDVLQAFANSSLMMQEDKVDRTE